MDGNSRPFWSHGLQAASGEWRAFFQGSVEALAKRFPFQGSYIA
jgi:hypothetical protein